ncbi:MAG: MerR family transcriptional regulator [Saprospiraceae bacterium]|nr:MerR family transcriptional regulator [Saprospiraceae bacterium]
MGFTLPELTKRYYTTAEVCKMFGITRATVRYWEEKFPQLNAHKFNNGERRFLADQVRMIEQVYLLVREKGYTIQGAQQELSDNKKWYKQKEQVLEKLREIRTGLEELRRT